jgi:CRP-like cAMP-binding protein
VPDSPRFVSPYERLIYLGSLPLLGSLPAHHLAVLAKHTVERHFPRGHVLFRAGQPVDKIHAIVTGTVTMSRWGQEVRECASGDAAGVFALLAGSDEGIEAVARTDLTTLELSGAALRDIFAGHFAIFEHILTMLALSLRGERDWVGPSAGFADPAPDPPSCPTHSLDLVERLLALRHAKPFAGSSLIGLAETAKRAEEIRLGQGQVLWTAGEPADSFILPICGTILCESELFAQSFRQGVGNAVGLTDALARQPRRFQASTDSGLIALSLDRNALIDAFEDDLEMGTQTMATLARELIAVLEKRAEISTEIPRGVALSS